MARKLDINKGTKEKILEFLDETLKEAILEKNREKIDKIFSLKDIAYEFFQKISTGFSDSIKVSGTWQIKCFEQGKLKWVDSGHNLVVDDGLDHIADQLSDQGETAMGWMAGGSDNTAPAAGQSALLSELGRVALDSKTQTAGNTVVYVATFGAGTATGTWEEVGIFNAAGAGVMLDRLLTGTKVKAAAETFEVTITLTISAV